MSILRTIAFLLTLLPPSPGRAQAEKDIWLEHSIEPTQPYVGQQVRYTLRLYQGISLDTLRLAPPAGALAEVRPLGEADVREVERDGRRYRLTEQRYAIFPFASGQTELRGGQALATRAGRPASADLKVEAPTVTLAVRPATSGETSWLPALALNLSESWSQSSSPPHVGEALQRTVRIEAQGLQAAQIPPLDITGPGFSAHRLPPTLLDRISPEGITGTREERWLIVPTAPGPLRVPPLVIDWFDTSRHAPARSELPPYLLDIAPAPAQPAPGTPPSSEPQPTTEAPVPAPPPHTEEPAAAPSFRIAVSALFGLLLVLALTALALRPRRKTKPLRALRAACRRNDARAAHTAALAWCRDLGMRGPLSLPALARHCGNPALAAALEELDRARFSPPKGTWRGDALRRLLQRQPTRATSPRDSGWGLVASNPGPLARPRL